MVLEDFLGKKCKIVYKDDERVKIAVGYVRGIDGFVLVEFDDGDKTALNIINVIKITTEGVV